MSFNLNLWPIFVWTIIPLAKPAGFVEQYWPGGSITRAWLVYQLGFCAYFVGFEYTVNEYIFFSLATENKNSFVRAREACIGYTIKSFDFTGTTNRCDFWIFFLILFVFQAAIDLDNMPTRVQDLYRCVLLIPSSSITVRRLRDAGYKFAWLWRALIPFYLLFQIWVLFFWLFKPSSQKWFFLGHIIFLFACPILNAITEPRDRFFSDISMYSTQFRNQSTQFSCGRTLNTLSIFQMQ